MLELLQFSFLYIKKVVAYCYIHFEYETKNKVSTNDTLNDTIRLTKNEQEILNLIVNNKQITRKEIVNKTKLSDRTISRAIKHLQDEKIILREGSKKTGYWKVLK